MSGSGSQNGRWICAGSRFLFAAMPAHHARPLPLPSLRDVGVKGASFIVDDESFDCDKEGDKKGFECDNNSFEHDNNNGFEHDDDNGFECDDNDGFECNDDGFECNDDGFECNDDNGPKRDKEGRTR